MYRIRTALFFLLLLPASHLFAQGKYFTKTGDVSFDASGITEDITADNKQTTFVLDSKSGAIELAVLMKAFEFERALMQEHFNENYVESDKYPRSIYKGKIADIEDVNFSKDGTYPVKIDGQLTIHGVTKEVPSRGTIIVKGGKVNGKASFKILLSDFNIDIPSIVKDKISKTVNINVAVWLNPLQ